MRPACKLQTDFSCGGRPRAAPSRRPRSVQRQPPFTEYGLGPVEADQAAIGARITQAAILELRAPTARNRSPVTGNMFPNRLVARTPNGRRWSIGPSDRLNFSPEKIRTESFFTQKPATPSTRKPLGPTSKSAGLLRSSRLNSSNLVAGAYCGRLPDRGNLAAAVAPARRGRIRRGWFVQG